MYTVTFEHPHFPEGKTFGLGNLGIVENGGSLEIDESAERMFMAVHHTSIEDAFKNRAGVTVSGSSELSPDDQKQYLPSEDAEVQVGSEPAPEVVVEDNAPEGVTANE